MLFCSSPLISLRKASFLYGVSSFSSDQAHARALRSTHSPSCTPVDQACTSFPAPGLWWLLRMSVQDFSAEKGFFCLQSFLKSGYSGWTPVCSPALGASSRCGKCASCAVFHPFPLLKHLRERCTQCFQQRLLCWIKSPHSSLFLGTVADLARSKSELLAENALLRQ